MCIHTYVFYIVPKFYGHCSGCGDQQQIENYPAGHHGDIPIHKQRNGLASGGAKGHGAELMNDSLQLCPCMQYST